MNTTTPQTAQSQTQPAEAAEQSVPQKVRELVSGKAKTVYATEDENALILHFRDDTSAFDGEKVAQITDKGRVNNLFNAFIMEHLEQQGVPTHFLRRLSGDESLVRRLDMVPVEFVVRNIAAGSLCKRLGIEQGRELEPPLFELFYKDDALHDPLISAEHAIAFGWSNEKELQRGRELSLEVNRILRKLFADAGILLVDYKLEFGRFDGELLLGDEFTPDGCRLWDRETREVLDKDRFRKDMGEVVESYTLVARRLNVPLE